MEATDDVEMAAQSPSRFVIKRDGTRQEFDQAKVLERIKALSTGLNEEFVTYTEVVDKVCSGIYDGKIFTN